MTKGKKILAVASTGGHWLQLQRLKTAFTDCNVIYVSTADYSDQIDERLYQVKDANQWDKLGLLIMAFQVLIVVLKENPDVVISTGAAPGFFGLLFGKILRKKTIWLDSIANSEELSLCGRQVKKYADLYLTQWPDLSTPEGAEFHGAVI